MNLPEEYYLQMQTDYDARRTLLLEMLQGAGFEYYTPRGAYYVMTEITSFGYKNDVDFARYLVEEIGVAVVPGSSFYHDPALGRTQVRFCFCKNTGTLLEAGERLTKLRIPAAT